MKIYKANRVKKQQGLAAIELTLILPFLLLLIFATAEFSRMLFQYNALNKLVRDASRHIINHATDNTQTINISATTTAEVNALFTYGNVANTTNELLPNLAGTTVQISVDGDFITISASYDWQPIFSGNLTSFGLGNDFDLSFPLVVNYTMRVL